MSNIKPSFTLSLRENSTLALKFNTNRGKKTLVFHDFINRGGVRYHLFGSKTEIKYSKSSATVRTAAVSEADGAPIPGLLVTYRFTEIPDAGAVYTSISMGSDVCLSKLTLRLMDVSWLRAFARESSLQIRATRKRA